jgi:hypothetical protein
MIEKTDSEGKKVFLPDLDEEHPYSFNTKVTPHKHLPDGTIINLETMKQYRGKDELKKFKNREEISNEETRQLKNL